MLFIGMYRGLDEVVLVAGALLFGAALGTVGLVYLDRRVRALAVTFGALGALLPLLALAFACATAGSGAAVLALFALLASAPGAIAVARGLRAEPL